MLFRTERIDVRRIDVTDADAMHAVYGNPEAMRWVDDGRPLDRDGCLKWIDVTLRNYATRGYGMSALVLHATGEVAGFCGLVHPGGQTDAEIKYAFRPDHWGKGLATEAVRGMLDHGAREHGLTRVIATLNPRNSASIRVLEKAGMTPEAPRREADGTETLVYAWARPGREEPPA